MKLNEIFFAHITFKIPKNYLMNNANVRQADGLLRQVFTVIDNRSIWDIKQKSFEDIKVKLYNVLVLLNSRPKKVNITFEDYSIQLMEWFNENYPKWKMRSRKKESAIPRQILQYFLTKYSRFKLEQIGIVTGDYDHSSISHAKQNVQDMIDTGNPEYCEIYNKVIEFLNGLKETK